MYAAGFVDRGIHRSGHPLPTGSSVSRFVGERNPESSCNRFDEIFRCFSMGICVEKTDYIRSIFVGGEERNCDWFPRNRVRTELVLFFFSFQQSPFGLDR
jgi:hypothetical protein